MNEPKQVWFDFQLAFGHHGIGPDGNPGLEQIDGLHARFDLPKKLIAHGNVESATMLLANTLLPAFIQAVSRIQTGSMDQAKREAENTRLKALAPVVQAMNGGRIVRP